MPEPTITRIIPKILIKLIDSPKKRSPIIDAIATLPPMIIGPPMEIGIPLAYALRAKKSIVKAVSPAKTTNITPKG